MAKKDKIWKMLYACLWASLVSLFVFLFIAFLATSTTLKSSINAGLSPRGLSNLVFDIFLITLVLSYFGNKTLKDALIEIFEKLYSKNFPFIITGIGYSLLLIVFLVVTNFGYHPTSNPIPSTPYELTMLALTGFSFILIALGIFLLILGFYAKKSLEREVWFTLQKANKILDNLDKVDGLNKTDRKNLKHYIYLTYKNIKKKIGKGLNLESPNSEDVPDSELKYTFKYYLLFYIDYAGEKELHFLRINLQKMKDLVKENDKIDWSVLIPTLLELKEEITKHLEKINFILTYQKSSRQSEWILENKDTIVQVIVLIVPIIVAILTVYLQAYIQVYLHPPPKT